MEDAPVPFMTPKSSKLIEDKEENLVGFNIDFNNNNYNFSLFDIDNRLKVKINEENNLDKDRSKYEAIIELDILKTVNKYFKMFDNFEEFKKDFIELCKPTNIKIIKINDKEIIIDIELAIKPSLTLNLNKVEMNEKEEIDFLIKENKNKNNIINYLKLDVQKMKEKITSLEKNINDLNIKINEFQQLKKKLIKLKKFFIVIIIMMKKIFNL